ncbi:MAG: hypothetical protein ACI9TY_000636 [Alphaproteobacteria bacterium]|jgi:hypothetical protein
MNTKKRDIIMYVDGQLINNEKSAYNNYLIIDLVNAVWSLSMATKEVEGLELITEKLIELLDIIDKTIPQENAS